LFPGYIFCRFDMSHRLPVLVIPGVMSVVTIGGSAIPLSEAELDTVRAVVASGSRYEPCAYTTIGQRVRIERGPLAGLEGIVTEAKKNYRLIISVDMLQRSVAVEIDWDCVKPITSKESGIRIAQPAANLAMLHRQKI
jgi:transcriptional antiterminator NusG